MRPDFRVAVRIGTTLDHRSPNESDVKGPFAGRGGIGSVLDARSATPPGAAST
jgi:hypothetical protein